MVLVNADFKVVNAEPKLAALLLKEPGPRMLQGTDFLSFLNDEEERDMLKKSVAEESLMPGQVQSLYVGLGDANHGIVKTQIFHTQYLDLKILRTAF